MVGARPLLILAVSFAACGSPPEDTGTKGAPLPPLQLRPIMDELKALEAAMPLPDERTQKELRDYGDIALQLVDADKRTASRAERALLEHDDAWFVLEPALAHDDVTVRQRAAWLCGLSMQSALQIPLLKRLKYELDGMTALWVADALCKLGNDAGIRWLSGGMTREHTREQAGQLAINALRDRGVEIPESPTWETLQALCSDVAKRWRMTGATSLQMVKLPNLTHVRARLAKHLQTPAGWQLRPVDDARFILRNLGTLGLEMMLLTLQSDEHYLRTMPMQELANLGPAANGIADRILPLLGDKLTALYTVRTLGEIGAQQALPYIRPLLDDPDTEVRAGATRTLGLLEDDWSKPRMEAFLQDENEALDVRVYASFALLCFGEHAQAEAFLQAREQQQDYHEATMTRIRERLAMRKQG